LAQNLSNDIESKEKQPIGWYDITHAEIWDKSDFSKVKNVYRIIQKLDHSKAYDYKRKKIAQFEYLLERTRNDQTAVFSDGSRIEPLVKDIVVKDRVTNSGRTRAAELIAGESAFRFDYAEVGTSQIPVEDSDYKLWAPVEGGRINLRLSGYASASGAIIKHSALWSPGLGTNTIWEFAPVDRDIFSIFQMIWARVVFPPNKPLVHQENIDFFTITHSTYTSSIA
jgi:hypothetical protein